MVWNGAGRPAGEGLSPMNKRKKITKKLKIKWAWQRYSEGRSKNWAIESWRQGRASKVSPVSSLHKDMHSRG